MLNASAAVECPQNAMADRNRAVDGGVADPVDRDNIRVAYRPRSSYFKVGLGVWIILAVVATAYAIYGEKYVWTLRETFFKTELECRVNNASQHGYSERLEDRVHELKSEVRALEEKYNQESQKSKELEESLKKLFAAKNELADEKLRLQNKEKELEERNEELSTSLSAVQNEKQILTSNCQMKIRKLEQDLHPREERTLGSSPPDAGFLVLPVIIVGGLILCMCVGRK